MPYAFGLRLLHWIIALCVMVLVPVGLMIEARTEANLWDALTNLLYGIHKAVGFSVLLLMVARIVLRLRHSTPPYPATLTHLQIRVAKGLHFLLYGLLLVVPLLGWAGSTAFPALSVFPGLDLPPMPGIPQDQALAETLFGIHGTLALLLAALAIGHIGAALWHLVKRKDEVFARMGFGSSEKKHRTP